MGIINRAAIEMVLSIQFWRMAIWWTLALLYSYLRLHLLSFLRYCQSSTHYCCCFCPNPTEEVRHPICIITGATSGLGAAAARAMAAEGYVVVLAGRSNDSLHKIIQEIMLENEDAHLKAFQVDMSSANSILIFESSFKKWLLDSDLHPSLQLLINNAGILATSSRVTADGYDQMMQINYLSAFLLTSLLLPLLKKSPVPSRIVNVTSFTHHCVSNLKIDSENFCRVSASENYPFANIYENSKLCLLLFSYELQRQLYKENPSSMISVIPVDPGAVRTNIMREIPVCLSQLAFRVLSLLKLLQSPEDGVSSIIDAALAPPGTSGVYFFGGRGRSIESSSLSYNENLAAELWSNSSKLVDEQMKLLRTS